MKQISEITNNTARLSPDDSEPPGVQVLQLPGIEHRPGHGATTPFHQLPRLTPTPFRMLWWIRLRQVLNSRLWTERLLSPALEVVAADVEVVDVRESERETDPCRLLFGQLGHWASVPVSSTNGV